MANGGLYSFTDDFQRENSKTLGGVWLDCHTTNPASFEPLGIYDGGVVVPDPFTRPGVYDSTPPSGHPPKDGKIYPGIGCAFLETGTKKVSVKVSGSGNLELILLGLFRTLREPRFFILLQAIQVRIWCMDFRTLWRPGSICGLHW